MEVKVEESAWRSKKMRAWDDGVDCRGKGGPMSRVRYTDDTSFSLLPRRMSSFHPRRNTHSSHFSIFLSFNSFKMNFVAKKDLIYSVDIFILQPPCNRLWLVSNKTYFLYYNMVSWNSRKVMQFLVSLFWQMLKPSKSCFTQLTMNGSSPILLYLLPQHFWFIFSSIIVGYAMW